MPRIENTKLFWTQNYIGVGLQLRTFVKNSQSVKKKHAEHFCMIGDRCAKFEVNLPWVANNKVGMILLFHGWTDGEDKQMDRL